MKIIRCLPKRYFQLDLRIFLVNWKSSQYCKIALLFSLFIPNLLTLTDVLGPLAQSAERGAHNAKVVSSTLTRTSIQKYFLLFLRVLLSVCLCVCSVSLLLCYYIFILGRHLF